jgi:hypothetical protein
LAKQSLAGQALTENDVKWIESYGVLLAGFHFYYADSYEAPVDNFPIVTRVFSSPLTDSALYVGLARPQALYVIVPDGKTNQLYRGAVMTYREFARPNDQLLDDQSWREMISRGQRPPAPPFTRSFYAETSVGELLENLRAQTTREDPDYGKLHDILWQIASRATEADLPRLLAVLTWPRGESRNDIAEGMAAIIAGLPWEPHRNQLIELLAARDHGLADAAARILVGRPASLDRHPAGMAGRNGTDLWAQTTRPNHCPGPGMGKNRSLRSPGTF